MVKAGSSPPLYVPEASETTVGRLDDGVLEGESGRDDDLERFAGSHGKSVLGAFQAVEADGYVELVVATGPRCFVPYLNGAVGCVSNLP